MRYQINTERGRSNLAAVIDGEIYSCDDTHPYWEEIKIALFDNDEDTFLDYIDMAEKASKQFLRVTDRVSVTDGEVYFDGDLVDNSLTQAIVRAMREGEDFTPLARFMDKIYQNPNRHSRENLYTWLIANEFSIDYDGDLICYKGVNSDYTSVHSGPGIVNGVAQDGGLDNSPGNVIEMPRSTVQHDPSQGCSVGLHVAHWDYASNWGKVTLKVKVNPRDVVSVPTDASFQKMRVCRYTVLGVVERPVETLFDSSIWDEFDEEEGAVW